MTRHILQNDVIGLPFSHSQVWWGLESQVDTPNPLRISFEMAKTIYVAMDLYASKGDILAGSATAGSPAVLSTTINGYVLTADDSQATGMRWGPAGAGEVNTASNLGVTVGRVGVYEQKVGADLQFNSLLSKTAALVLFENTTNEEIDFTIADVVKSGNSGLMTGADKRYLDDDVLDKDDFLAKGNILIGTGTGTYIQLPLGSDDQVLTVDSLKATGIAWETPPGAGGGEANTASNLGVSSARVGLYHSKSGVDLRFKSLLSTTAWIVLTDNTTNNEVEISANRRHSIVAQLDTGTTYLQLDGDLASPGNSKVYGTNASGVRGWYDTTASGEVNVGQNIGVTAGRVGWYKTKVGVALQFKSALSKSGCLTITDNVANDEVDFGLNHANGSITCFNNNLQLVNDSGAPGLSQLYGTDASGNKGWFPQPSGVGGEANIGENLGVTTGRVGVYERKTGVVLQFNSLVGRNGLSFAEDDPNDEILCDVNARWSVTAGTGWVQLVGDEESPGTFTRYGTNTAGTRGFFPAADMFRSTYDTAGVNQQLVGISAFQSVFNKVILASTVVTPTLTLKQSPNPTPTGEGEIEWDTDDNRMVIGDGQTTSLQFSDDTKLVLRSDYSNRGVLLAGTGTALYEAVGLGTAGQILTVDDGQPTGIAWVDPPAGIGEANIGENRGGGTEIYDGKSGVTLYFNTLTVPATPALTIVENESLNQVQFGIADATLSVSGLFTGAEKNRLANDVVTRFDYTGLGVILAGTGANSYISKPAGGNGQALLANSAVAGGVEWSTLPPPGEANVGENRGTGVPIYDGKEPSGVTLFFNSLQSVTAALLIQESEAENVVQFFITDAVLGGQSGLFRGDEKNRLANDVIVRQDFDLTGDLLVGTGNDTYTRIPVGSNGQRLTANSGVTGGVEWVTPTSGGVTDHGDLTGLNDSSAWLVDHTWAAVLIGRPSGQTLHGGTGAGESLTLVSNSSGTAGSIIMTEIAAGAATPPNGYFMRIDQSGVLASHQFVNVDDIDSENNPDWDYSILTVGNKANNRFQWGAAGNSPIMGTIRGLRITGNYTTGADGYIVLTNTAGPTDQTPPVGSDEANLFAHNAGSGITHLWAKNSVGTPNQLTSHDPDTGEIIHNSFNPQTGYKQWINMFKLLEWLAEKYCEATGEPLESVWQHCPHDPEIYATLKAEAAAGEA